MLKGDILRLERVLLLYCAGAVLLSGIGACFVVLGGYAIEARFALSTLFFAGGITCLLGFWKYVPPGPTIPAFWGLLLIDSMISALLGIGFLVIVLTQSGAASSVPLAFTYGCFASAGTASLFLGVYALMGRLTLEVAKNPLKPLDENGMES